MSVTRIQAASTHLALSVLVAAACAAAIFGLWYPGPHRHLAGGQNLFWLIVAVDVVLGPLLTLVVFNPKKPRAELVRDLAIVAALQLAALAYGVWTMHQARPVHLVFEVDRFRIVSASDIDPADLPQAPADLQRLPLTGPTTIAVRRSKDSDELLRSIEAAAAGRDLSMQPARWIPYGPEPRAEAWSRAQPWPDFVARFAATHGPALERARADLREHGLNPDSVRLLPLQGRFGVWSVAIDPAGELRAFLPIDPF